MNKGLTGIAPAAWLALALLIALGAWLRLRTLGADPLWNDEAMTLTYTSRSFADLWLRPDDPTPPLYYTLHKLLVGGAETEAGIRWLSAAAGIAAIPLVFFLGRSLAGIGAGLAAALFLAVQGAHIEYSQEARAYAVFWLIELGSALALAEHLRRDRAGTPGSGRCYAVWAVLSVVGVYAQYVGLFWIASVQAVLLVDLLLRPERGRRFLRWSVASLYMLLGVLPAFWFMAGQMSHFGTAPDLTPAGFVSILRDVLFVRDGPPWLRIVEIVLAGTLAAAVPLLLRNRPAALVAAAFALFPFLMWAGEIFKPTMMFRTAALAMFASLIVWSVAVSRLPRPWGALLAAVVATGLLTSHLCHERVAPLRYDWRGAEHYIAERVRPGDVVILCRWWIWPAFRYHATDDLPAPIVGVWDGDRANVWPAPADEREPWRGLYRPTELPLTSPEKMRAEQRPGSSGWVVRSHCGPDRRHWLDGFLANLGVEAEEVWAGQGVAVDRVRF